jgi:preprotein translocase subunit SecG
MMYRTLLVIVVVVAFVVVLVLLHVTGTLGPGAH